MKHPEPIALNRKTALAGWVYLPFYLLLLSVLLVGILSALGIDLTTPAQQLHLNLLYGCINFIVVGLIFRTYLIEAARRISPRRMITALLIGFAVYFFGTQLMQILTELLSPGLENINNESLITMGSSRSWELALYAIALVPLAEECLFRGLIFTSLYRYGRFWAYFVSMVLFSAIHVMGYVQNYSVITLILCFLQYLPASFALAWVMEYSGSIWSSVAIHTIANTIAMAGIWFGQ